MYMGETRVGAWRRASSFPSLAVKRGAFFAFHDPRIDCGAHNARQLNEDLVSQWSVSTLEQGGTNVGDAKGRTRQTL